LALHLLLLFTMPVNQGINTDRRAADRLPLALPVFVRGTTAQGEEFLEFTTALNVSTTGMLVAMQRELPLRACVTLEMAAANAPGRSARTLTAELVRVSNADGWRLCGFQFSAPLNAEESCFPV
jgi:c-di-GMP-binding flagellar brake protein YcgR